MLGPQFEQLRMLMPAQELRGRIPDSNDRVNESMSELWDRKGREAALPAGTYHPSPEVGYDTTHGTGVTDSLKQHGYDGAPVEVRHYTDSYSEGKAGDLFIYDGHHRVAAAADLGMDIPVSHSDSKSDRVLFRGTGSHDVRLGSQRRREAS
jgi:hypothetical protein